MIGASVPPVAREHFGKVGIAGSSISGRSFERHNYYLEWDVVVGDLHGREIVFGGGLAPAVAPGA